MSRYDKTQSAIGNFRAPLNAAWTATSGPGAAGTPTNSDLWKVIGVALNGSGRLIKATTAISCVGIVVVHGAKNAGDIQDVLTNGEVVELDLNDIQGATAPTAGTKYYLDVTAGRLTATVPAAGVNGFYVGTTVEASRLVVRCGLVQG